MATMHNVSVEVVYPLTEYEEVAVTHHSLVATWTCDILEAAPVDLVCTNEQPFFAIHVHCDSFDVAFELTLTDIMKNPALQLLRGLYLDTTLTNSTLQYQKDQTPLFSKEFDEYSDRKGLTILQRLFHNINQNNAKLTVQVIAVDESESTTLILLRHKVHILRKFSCKDLNDMTNRVSSNTITYFLLNVTALLKNAFNGLRSTMDESLELLSRAVLPSDFDLYETDHIDPDMRTKLYSFQKKSVSWMLRREGVRYVNGEAELIEEEEDDIFKNKEFGVTKWASLGMFSCEDSDIRVTEPCRGGILAEEVHLSYPITYLRWD